MEECSTINDLFSYLQVITHMRTHTVNLWAATVSNAIYGHVDHHHHHHHHLTPHNFNLINRLIFMLNCITRDRERQRELRVQRIKIRLKLLLSFWMNWMHQNMHIWAIHWSLLRIQRLSAWDALQIWSDFAMILDVYVCQCGSWPLRPDSLQIRTTHNTHTHMYSGPNAKQSILF